MVTSPHRTISIRDVPVSGDVLFYCKAGVRGKKAIHRLIELGVDGSRLYNLDGGIMRWQKGESRGTRMVNVRTSTSSRCVCICVRGNFSTHDGVQM